MLCEEKCTDCFSVIAWKKNPFRARMHQEGNLEVLETFLNIHADMLQPVSFILLASFCGASKIEPIDPELVGCSLSAVPSSKCGLFLV